MNGKVKKIFVSEWTKYPGGRFRETGDFSGEEFREKFLEGPESEGYSFELDFNNLFTVGWSFIDESLGYFVSKIGEKEFRRRFKIIADDDPDIFDELETVIEKRLRRR